MTIEKNKISTSSKMATLQTATKEAVQKLLEEALTFLRDDGHIPKEQTTIELAHVTRFTSEELATSPVGTMQLR